MARHPEIEKEIEQYIDRNDELDPYPTEGALSLLNCLSDSDITATERCKILERALRNVFDRLEVLENRV